MEEERRQYMSQLIHTMISLVRQKNADRLGDLLLRASMDFTHCDLGVFLLFENNSLIAFQQLLRSRNLDLRKKDADAGQIALYEAAIHLFLKKGTDPIAANNLYDLSAPEYALLKELDSCQKYQSRSLLFFPLVLTNQERAGALLLINSLDDRGQPVPFSAEICQEIHDLADLASVALSNIHYLHDIRLQMNSFVDAMTTAIDERTPYNGNHSRKIAGYCLAVCDKINEKYETGEGTEFFDENRREQLRMGALLHDLGKLITPLEIMNKPTRLSSHQSKIENRFKLIRAYQYIDYLEHRQTEEEYEKEIRYLDASWQLIIESNLVTQLKVHSIIPLQILARKVYCRPSGETLPYLTSHEAECLMIPYGTLTFQERKIMQEHVILTRKLLRQVHFTKDYERVPIFASRHHEFLDGSGYPDHLTGDQLSLEAKILAVADIYDALTAADRPYKDPISREDAFEILQDMADHGKIDPWLVSLLQETELPAG